MTHISVVPATSKLVEAVSKLTAARSELMLTGMFGR
jgi:hypothetical protein